MSGRGSSCGRAPFSDANGLILDMADEILSVVHHTPVIAGVFASDPYRDMRSFLEKIADLGFSGVQNFPSAGSLLACGEMMENLEATGYGYSREVEMVRIANEMDLLTTPYCWSVEQARAMAETGTDIIVAHMGLTTKGLIGAAQAQFPGGLRAQNHPDRPRGQGGQSRRHGHQPRRQRIGTGGRPVHLRARSRDVRLLRRLLRGALPSENALIGVVRAFKEIKIARRRV